MQTQTTTPIPPPADAATSEYTAEIRFGVVMYGGVSLAIYINGVTNELFEMACATPRTGVTLDRDQEPSTREIYRRLSWLAGNPQLRKQYAQALKQASASSPEPNDVWAKMDKTDCSQTRLVIDVIAGTSAGGINGVFLAKALANGEQFGALKNLWINEGDIGLLLNDSASYRDTVPKIANRSDKPTSLLNSDRMYAKLLYAIGQMAPLKVAAWPSDKRGSPLVEEIDLFVTTTDIRGSVVPLRLFDKVVNELRYKQNFRFSYPNGVTPSADGIKPPGNDFDAVNNPFLAFAARCTSSFPFAFEPMTLAAVARLKADGGPPGVKRWRAFFPNLSHDEVAQNAHEHRTFGDGGYLDNKPFTYVVETLAQRFSSVPLERKLVFIEPAPEQLDPNCLPDPDNPPDALENSIAALTSIPRYESIREDLQSVLQRNRRIERVERIVRLGEIDIEKCPDPFSGVLKGGGTMPNWSLLKLSEMVGYYGLAFLPYQRLRAYAVTDGMADRLGRRWGIDRQSDRQYALRALVRVWRERRFNDEGKDGRETINAFLDQFDLDYRVRRLGFLLRKIDQMTRLFRKRCTGPLDSGPGMEGKPSELSEAELQMLRRLPKPYAMLPAELELAQVRAGLHVLGSLKAGLIDVRTSLLEAQRFSDSDTTPPRNAAQDPQLRKELEAILDLVLGQTSTQAPVTVSGVVPEHLVSVVLGSDATHLASISRTLQESVLFRAEALFTAAAMVQRTPLHQALENDIEAMRFKGNSKEQDPIGIRLNTISARAWQLLGEPYLALAHADGDNVIALVGDAVVAPDNGVISTVQLADLNAGVGRVLRQFLGYYLLRFDSFDQMSFPLYYDTGTGEPSTVEAVRISPVDATNLIDVATDSRRKLAGTALANFGAFLDRRWRLNDIMWGRLDGAERLIQALLPMADDDTKVVRRELIELAQRGILREALVPEGNENLADLVVKALDEVPGSGNTAQRLQSMLAQLWTGNRSARDRLGEVLVSLLSERGLMNYVRTTREIDSAPDPKTTLESAARAVTITGRILDVISAKHGNGSLASRWLARLGLILQGIVAVSLPGTLKHRWWSHGIKLLYSFEVVAAAAAFLFGSADMRSLAFTALGLTFGVHLLTLIAGDILAERKRWLYITVIAVLLGLIGLAALGVWSVAFGWTVAGVALKPLVLEKLF